jgi:hypothetical protein
LVKVGKHVNPSNEILSALHRQQMANKATMAVGISCEQSCCRRVGLCNHTVVHIIYVQKQFDPNGLGTYSDIRREEEEEVLYFIKEILLLIIMPKAKDLTNELVHLRGHVELSPGLPTRLASPERPLAFNPWSAFFWTVVIGFGLVQFGFIAWLV